MIGVPISRPPSPPPGSRPPRTTGDQPIEIGASDCTEAWRTDSEREVYLSRCRWVFLRELARAAGAGGVERFDALYDSGQSTLEMFQYPDMASAEAERIVAAIAYAGRAPGWAPPWWTVPEASGQQCAQDWSAFACLCAIYMTLDPVSRELALTEIEAGNDPKLNGRLANGMAASWQVFCDAAEDRQVCCPEHVKNDPAYSTDHDESDWRPWAVAALAAVGIATFLVIRPR